MAIFANSAVSDVIATTIESRTQKTADNLTNNNAFLRKMKERGNVKTISGGSIIFQELRYNDLTTNYANSFSGYDTINISPDSPISAASFNLKHYAAAVSISGPEMLANSGKEQMIDLLETRVEIAEGRLLNKVDVDLHGNEATNSGKAFSGLADMLTQGSAPSANAGPSRIASGTYGNINRASWTFWQHLYGTGTGNTGAACTSATIQKAINKMVLPLVRGTDRTDLIYCGNTAYELFLESLQAIQRITSNDDGNAGFSALKYYGSGGACDVVLGGGIGGNAIDGTMLLLNTRHIFFRPHKDRNFTNIGDDRHSVNQDAVVRLMGFSGALTCDGLQFQGRLDATT